MCPSNDADSTDALEQLRQYLATIPPGQLASDIRSRVIGLLMVYWPRTSAASLHRTQADKLGRAEEVKWMPPNLEFALERHGATVLGSTRANVHYWSINVDTGIAEIKRDGKRQVESLAPHLDARKLAYEIAQAIEQRAQHDALEWIGPDDVRVIANKVIPDDAAQQTVAGRRRRFRNALVERLNELGWSNYRAYYHFRK